MAQLLAYYGSRDYTMPAIEQRIEDLLKRRIGALEGLPTESTKERLAKYKEYRNARQGILKTTHRHVLEMVAYILNTEASILEEGIIDKDEYVQTFSSFFNEGGRHAIVIYYQPMGPPPFESGRWSPQISREQSIVRCCITDGTTEKFCGKCVIVYRLRSNVGFETKQLLEETYYAFAEVDLLSRSALAAISSLISRLNEPAITTNIQWGELTKSEAGKKIKNNFIGDLKDFCEFLSVTKIDLEGAIKFDIDLEFYEKYLSRPEDVMKNSKNPEVLCAVEENVTNWMKIMERAIVESQQLRRETETVGPTAELTYWRRLLARFSSIIEHIKSPYAQMFIQLLIQAKSKLAKKWKRLDNHVTTVQILSQDNVKYLYALERFTQPLYRLDPTKIGDYLPALMYAIRMIYATSRFFNTRRMVTAVFVKMTNQLILACKAYLTENGTLNIWHDAKVAVISRMKDCIKLCEQYYDCYNEMRKKVNESTDEKPFEVSEMYVFGKFNAFKTRLNKLIDVLEIALNYSVLRCSTIEGIDAFAQKFTNFFEKISSQLYDPLDHRKPYFDTDYEEFKKNVAETEIELRDFFTKIVSVVPNIDAALQLVARFKKMKFKRLRVDRKYLELVVMYQREIEAIRDIYNEDRSDPPVPRNVPPIAGRIMWIRQLYRRAEAPMDIFKTRERVITHERMQKCIKIYNALVTVFVHYERLYYKAWFDSVEIVRLALSSPLLIRHPKTNKYILNFDPYITEVIGESEHMSRFGLTVPDFIQIITFCKEKIFASYESVKRLVEKNDEMRRSIPILFLNLMKTGFVKLEIAFQPCLSVVTWASLKIPEVCENISNTINELEIFSKEVKDMKEARVDEVFESVAETKLMKLVNYAQIPNEFVAENQTFGSSIAIELEIKSSAAEKAVITIINKFLGLITDPEVETEKYNWLDSEKVMKQVGSQSKLTKGPFEPGGSVAASRILPKFEEFERELQTLLDSIKI